MNKEDQKKAYDRKLSLLLRIRALLGGPLDYQKKEVKKAFAYLELDDEDIETFRALVDMSCNHDFEYWLDSHYSDRAK